MPSQVQERLSYSRICCGLYLKKDIEQLCPDIARSATLNSEKLKNKQVCNKGFTGVIAREAR